MLAPTRPPRSVAKLFCPPPIRTEGAGASPFLLVSPAFLVYTVSRVRENGGTLVNIRHKRGARLLTRLLGLALALPAAAERVENRAITLPENEAGMYTGELADGLPEGDGLFICQTPDGKSWTYEGRFVKGVFEGPGRLTWTDGSVRDGQFSGGKLNGFGKYIDPDGATIYEGEWKDNECSGQGTIRKDGYVWKGTFARDKLNGDGAIYTADGELVYRGRFRDNVMADGLLYKDGVVYTVKNGVNLGKARRPNEGGRLYRDSGRDFARCHRRFGGSDSTRGSPPPGGRPGCRIVGGLPADGAGGGAGSGIPGGGLRELPGLLLGAAGGGGGMPLLRLPPFLAGWRIAARVRDNASNGEPPPNRRGLFFHWFMNRS